MAADAASTAATQVGPLSAVLPPPTQAEHRQGHGRVGVEQCDVDGRLEHGLTAVQQHDEGRPDDASDQEILGHGIEESEDERDLADGDGLRLAADLDVEHPELGGREHQGEQPPRDVETDGRVRRAGDDAEPEGTADDRQDGDEGEHPPGRALGPARR